MFSSITIFALVGASALALPKPGNRGSAACTTYLDTFDDLTADLLPELSPVGVYHGLQYTDWDVNPVDSTTGGVIPQSGSNVAAAAINEDLLSGDITFSPFGTISITGDTSSFDLNSFYFACTNTAAQGDVSLAESCVIAVSGYYFDGSAVPEATFAFSDTTLSNPMVLAQLPSSYVDLTNVTIGVASAGILATETIIYIDSLSHCNRS